MTALQQIYLILKIQFWMQVVGIPIYLIGLAYLEYPRRSTVTRRFDAFRCAWCVAAAAYLWWLVWGAHP